MITRTSARYSSLVLAFAMMIAFLLGTYVRPFFTSATDLPISDEPTPSLSQTIASESNPTLTDGTDLNNIYDKLDEILMELQLNTAATRDLLPTP